MSSWKKASKVNQKTHRERHQPQSQAHLGLLEKKKDYRLRADDYNSKQSTLKILRRRALNRNPDEFYFHMINSQLKDGGHCEVVNDDADTPEQIKLMESKNLKYIAMKRTVEVNKINKLQSELHLVDTANQVKNSHIFFVDNDREIKTFNLAERLDTHPALINRKANRLKKSSLKAMSFPQMSKASLKEMLKQKNKMYSELGKRIERKEQLGIIQQKLEMKKHLQDKKLPPPRKIKPGTKESAPVYLWKSERKR